MVETLVGLGWLLVALAVVLYGLGRVRARRRAQDRWGAAAEDTSYEAEEAVRPARLALRRRRFLPWLLAAAAALSIHFVVGWSYPLVIAAGLIAGLLGGQLEAWYATRRAARIELQLADAIDLMIGAVSAGAGVSAALAGALRESHAPLREQLEDVSGRIRLGDDPQAALLGLAARVPLETFQLFASALSVHWETGGNLAPTLANVGRTIRDRVEIARRIQSNIAQSQLSTVAVLGVTYFLALVVWRSNPDQTALFVNSTIGQWMVAGTALLQAVGIVWMAAMSRPRF